MKHHQSNRRRWLTRLSVTLGSIFVFRKISAESIQTPKSAEGPFYPSPSMRTADVDNDLVKVEGVVAESGGEIITLKGVVTNKEGISLPGVRVEIWQCDINGKYLHTGDKQNFPHDTAFQGFGHDITNENGEYTFRTIKPSKYPSRTQHIHVKVLSGEKDLLTTQFYIDGEPNNKNDFLFRKLSEKEAAAVSMRFTQEGDHTEAVVNIVV